MPKKPISDRGRSRSWAGRSIKAAAGVALLAAAPETGRVASVTDGDTCRLVGGERIRIAGIDAPETQPWQARCRRERIAGERASRDLTALLAGRAVRLVRVGRSYRRTVARVSLDGRDLAGILVARGLAKPWPRRAPKPGWCAD